jgi:glucose/arabinose dehydrogenase
MVIAFHGCGDTARRTVPDVTGPNPLIGEPTPSLIPTVHVAKAVGWPEGSMPTAAAGFVVTPFARFLDHPRWLYVLPNGDVLVAETNAPTRPDDNKGIKGWFFKTFMKKAGSSGPSANRITLLRDVDGDGVAEFRSVLLSGLNSPFGMTLVDSTLYVANTDAVRAFPYHPGETVITSAGTQLVPLPAGPINHHWTKNLIASRDGRYLYATVGSNSNAAENGIEAEKMRAGILEIEIATRAVRVFASGMRNPNGLAWEPQTGALWTVVNERDELGSDLVPDYLTSVRDGGFYGWPYSYFGSHVDTRVKPQRPDLVATAIVPDYALGPHTASLGLTFYLDSLFPARFFGGAFIGQHGSWNRKPWSGYKVIFVPFAEGKPAGLAEDILTGFLDSEGQARGRPVGVVVDSRGALLVADDVGNAVWRIVPRPTP